MYEPGKLAGDAISARRDMLANAIVERQWKLRPDLERRYGPSGFSKCLEDAHFHLQYLAEALEASEPQLFRDYISWTKVMLASRNIPAEDLANHLQLVRDVVSEGVPAEMRDFVGD
jgi:MerR family transcriptional regulator, light-induced transcriptional regulator